MAETAALRARRRRGGARWSTRSSEKTATLRGFARAASSTPSRPASRSCRAENQQLGDLGKRLKDDPAALEDAARRELGLVREGETLVIVRDGKPASK